MTNDKDPIQEARERATEQPTEDQVIGALVQSLMTLLQNHDPRFVASAAMSVAAIVAKTHGQTRADFRTGAAQVYDGIAVGRKPPTLVQ